MAFTGKIRRGGITEGHFSLILSFFFLRRVVEGLGVGDMFIGEIISDLSRSSASSSGGNMYLSTVNVDIFVQLNFRASSPMTHNRAVKFSRICCLFVFVLL